MQEQENKQTNECQCVGNKKIKKLEKEIADLREKVIILEKSLQRIRSALK